MDWHRGFDRGAGGEATATFAAASSEVLYVIRLRPQVAVEFVSPGVEGLLGYHPEDFYDDPALWNAVIGNGRHATGVLGDVPVGQDSAVTLRWLAKSGDPVWVHHRSKVVRRADGSVVLHGAFRATDSTHVAENLAEQVTRLQAIVDNVTDIVLEFALDNTVRWVSPSIERILGWHQADLIGRTSADFIHPEEYAAAVAERDHPTEGVATVARLRLRTADGGYRWMSGVSRETRDANNRLLGRVVGLQDVHATVLAEQARAVSEEHYRLLAENGSDLVFRASPGPEWKSEWISASTESVFGIKAEDFPNRPVGDLVHPEDLHRVEEAAEAIRSGNRHFYEARLRVADGSYHWFAITVRPLWDNEGRVIARVGTAHDINAEVEARLELARSEQRFRLAMESAPMGMALVDLDRRFTQVNPALCRMVDHSEDWLLAHSIADILEPDDDAVDRRMRERILTGNTEYATSEKRLLRRDGTGLWVEHSIGLLRDDGGTPLSYVSQLVDITAAKRIQHDLTYLAEHDPLTHLLTRQALVQEMQRVTSHPPRSHTRVGALYIDIDRFKETNDTHGHAGGDHVLTAVADRIASHTRSEDLVARIGGDEIIVILPNIHTTAEADVVANKIHDAMRTPVTINGQPVRPQVSIGIALAAPDEEPDQLLNHADRALYRAKRQGRNQTVTYDPTVDGASW